MNFEVVGKSSEQFDLSGAFTCSTASVHCFKAESSARAALLWRYIYVQLQSTYVKNSLCWFNSLRPYCIVDMLYISVVLEVFVGFKDSFGEPCPPPGARALLSCIPALKHTYVPLHELAANERLGLFWSPGFPPKSSFVWSPRDTVLNSFSMHLWQKII